MEPISQAEVLRQIWTVQSFLKTNPEINNNIYKAMNDLSKLPKPLENEYTHFDRYLASVYNFLSSVDEVNRELALTVGQLDIIRDKRPEISKQSLIPAINIFLEACRLLIITNRFDNTMLRKILLLVLGVFNILRGNLVEGVPSLIEIYTKDIQVIVLVGRTMSLMYNWITPDIQEKGVSNIYASAKSMIIGAWLYVLSIVSPEMIRQKIGQLVPLGEFPQDNIQKIQTLFHDPKIVCALKSKIVSAREEAPIRIVLELLNVPDNLDAFCNGITGDAGALASLEMSEVPDVPELKGGRKPRRFSKL